VKYLILPCSCTVGRMLHKRSSWTVVNITTSTLRKEHTHTHPFNGPLSGTARVSQYQKGKTNLDFTGARDSEWQWHQLCMCKSAPHSRQITTPASHHSVFYRLDALPAAQPTASKLWRHTLRKEQMTKKNLNCLLMLPIIHGEFAEYSAHWIIMVQYSANSQWKEVAWVTTDLHLFLRSLMQ